MSDAGSRDVYSKNFLIMIYSKISFATYCFHKTGIHKTFIRRMKLGPLVWPKAPSVDFKRHFVRENKTNGRKKNDRNSKILIQMNHEK